MNNPYQQGANEGRYAEEQQYSTYGQPRRKNILGIVGFIFSVTCLLAPLGLLMSFIALFKRPRGFAIAGVLVGALFSIPHGIFAFSAIRIAMMSPAELTAEATGAEVLAIFSAAGRALDERGSIPESADQLDLSESTTTDFWGNPYRLEGTSSSSLKIFSMGPDGILGTDDDIDLTDLPTDSQRRRDLIAILETEIDPATFDRDAVKDEMGRATSDFVSSFFGGFQAGSQPAPATPDTPAEDSDPDTEVPADPAPADPAPADPATP